VFKVIILSLLIFSFTGLAGADPTRPAGGGAMQSKAETPQNTGKPVLDAIIKKGDTLIAVIDGKLTTEGFDSDSLRVHKISGKQAEVEYIANGNWNEETLTLASTAFSKKSKTNKE